MKVKIDGGLPFQFPSPYGLMEVVPCKWEFKESRFVFFHFAALARPVENQALNPVKISPLKSTIGEIALDLTTGIVVERDNFKRDTYEYRVLDSLLRAPGVTVVEP